MARYCCFKDSARDKTRPTLYYIENSLWQEYELLFNGTPNQTKNFRNNKTLFPFLAR